MGAIWKKITDHPLAAGLITFLGLLAAYWSLFTDKKIPEVLKDQKWVLAMIPWYYTFVGLVGVIAAVLYVILIRDVRAKRKDLGWLEDLARSDDENMTHRVRLEDQKISVASDIKNPYDPHVIFRVPIFNGSIYDLTLEEKLEGHFFIEVTEGLMQLPDEPKIYQMPGIPKHIEARRARHFDVLIRQRIPEQTAKYIQSKGNALFWADSICLQFTYRNSTRTHKTLPIKITGTKIHLSKV